MGQRHAQTATVMIDNALGVGRRYAASLLFFVPIVLDGALQTAFFKPGFYLASGAQAIGFAAGPGTTIVLVVDGIKGIEVIRFGVFGEKVSRLKGSRLMTGPPTQAGVPASQWLPGKQGARKHLALCQHLAAV